MKKFEHEFEQIKQLIEDNTRFVLLSHVHTDGDALGSLIALYHYLRNRGKEVSVYVPGEVPDKYFFLNTQGIVGRGSRAQQAAVIAGADVLFILDISALKRLDEYYEDVKESRGVKIAIDHHPLDPGWTDVTVIDAGRIATAELVYDLFEFLKAEITPAIAVALYAAILSDSGSFRFFKTGAATFRMAAELVEAGAEPAKIYSLVFETAHTEQLRNWGTLLAKIKREEACSSLIISKEFMQSSGLQLHEADGLIDIMRRDNLANVFIVFVEKEKKEILVGLRSKDSFDVGSTARSFGGGGHFHAAGFTSIHPLEETVKMTLKKIKEDMREKK